MPEWVAELAAGSLDPARLAVAAAFVLLGASVQGFLGFGYGIVVMSGLTLADDLLHAAGVVNLTGLLLTGSALWHLREGALWRRAAWIVPGLLVGVPLGVTALGQFDRTWMVRALGVTVIAISAWNLIAPTLRPPHGRGLDLGVGFVAGLLGGAFNTGGPPLVAHLYAGPEPPESAKATIQALFVAIGLSRLPFATGQGLMGPSIWLDSLLLAPVVLLGLVAGIRLARRVPPEHFRRIAWLALGSLGLVLLATA